MKHAYVSMVLPLSTMPEPRLIERVDALLAEHARAHEIVLVVPLGQLSPAEEPRAIRGPVSVVTTHTQSSPNGALIAGLARAVGDFVVEWRGPIEAIDGPLIADLLAPTDEDVELVEAIGIETSRASRLFSRVINRLRPRELPLRKSHGRAYSRHAVQAVLRACTFEPRFDVIIAELPVRRASIQVPFHNPHSESATKRLSAALALLTRGTRLGAVVPLALAAMSALLGASAAIYAIGVFLLRGQTPEGWTTLTVLIGLGQAAVLTILGLIWNRVDTVMRGLSQPNDVTVETHVWAPFGDTGAAGGNSEG